MLELARIPLLKEERDERHPLIVAGGPLTFSNPDPLEPFVDVLVQGEAEELIHALVEAARLDGARGAAGAPGAHAGLPGARAGWGALLRLQGRGRAAAGPLADHHAAHRAALDVPHRAGARLLAGLPLLRDAADHQRRHADGAARAGAVAHSGARQARGPGGRGGDGSPAHRGAAAHPGGLGARGGRVLPARGPAHPGAGGHAAPRAGPPTSRWPRTGPLSA